MFCKRTVYRICSMRWEVGLLRARYEYLDSAFTDGMRSTWLWRFEFIGLPWQRCLGLQVHLEVCGNFENDIFRWACARGGYVYG